jgi:hypothetical protein
MTPNACRPTRKPQLIARDVDFTLTELQGMQRAFSKARAASDSASDQDLVLRILRSYITARKAA